MVKMTLLADYSFGFLGLGCLDLSSSNDGERWGDGVSSARFGSGSCDCLFPFYAM